MELSLVLHDNASLKAKRSVLQRIKSRTRNKFNVSIAETADQDCTDRGTLCCAVVGSDGRLLRSVLDKIENFIVQLEVADVLDAPKVIEHY